MYEPDPRNPLIATLVGEYLELGLDHACPGHRQRVACVITAFGREFGAWKVKDLKPLDYKRWMAQQVTWRANHTKSNSTKTIKALFNFAVANDRIDKNPLAHVSYTALETRRVMRDDEFRALLRRTDGTFKRVLLFLRLTGCRPGELCAARWKHYDRERHIIVLPHHKTYAKTGGKPRVIVLVPALIRLLAYLERQRPTALYREAVRRATGIEPPPLPNADEEFIFLNKRGKRWVISNMDQRMHKLRERCGIDASLKLYGARHAYATELVSRNLNLHIVATLVGHSRVETTSRHYVHIQGDIDLLRAAAEKAMGLGRSGKEGGQ